jgi:cell division protein FtsB
MADERTQAEKILAGVVASPISQQTVAWTQRLWRPVATVLALGFALLITAGVVNGDHGLRVWLAKRAEDRQLQMQIQQLQQENTRLRNHVERLNSDPNAIEQAARNNLHYAKPGEVIVALPPDQKTQIPVVASGK